jgi:hypothetical protein
MLHEKKNTSFNLDNIFRLIVPNFCKPINRDETVLQSVIIAKEQEEQTRRGRVAGWGRFSKTIFILLRSRYAT